MSTKGKTVITLINGDTLSVNEVDMNDEFIRSDDNCIIWTDKWGRVVMVPMSSILYTEYYPFTK